MSGRVFCVWFSVFNLFSTMVFWALMADRFTPEQSKRLYGAIAVGGTLGAIFGPWLASVLVKPLGTAAMLLVSAGFLLAAIGAARAVAWLQPGPTGTRSGSASVIEPYRGKACGGYRFSAQSRDCWESRPMCSD